MRKIIMEKSINNDGQTEINQYVIQNEIGRG